MVKRFLLRRCVNALGLILFLTTSFDTAAQNVGTFLDCNATAFKRTKIEGGDFDDKTQKVSYVVVMTNKSMSKSTGPLTATFYGFGESVHDRKAFKLLQTETFDFELEPRTNFEHKTEELALKYDTTDVSFGEKFKGWVVQVVDAEGNKVLEKISTAFLTDTQNLGDLKVGSYCDKNTKTIPTPKRR